MTSNLLQDLLEQAESLYDRLSELCWVGDLPLDDEMTAAEEVVDLLKQKLINEE